jgi:hypothetical protein
MIMSIRSIDLKNVAITLLVIAGIFAAGLLVGKYFLSTHNIEVKEKIIYKTVYKEKIQPIFDQDNFNRLLTCYNSELKFTDTTNNDWLIIHVEDACKSADAKYKIGTYGNWTIYGGIAIVAAAAGGYTMYKLKR